MEMPKPRLGLREFFLQIGSIITLYVSAITLLSLLFEIIDYAYRPLNGGYYRPSISWPVAMLIVIFPLFVMFSWMLQRAYDAHPDRKTSILRSILVYITIFLSIGVIAGDLIAVLYYYLDGQIITTGFMLKVLAVFCVAVLIFVYYISDLRNKLNKKTELVFISIAALIVILSVGFGFSVLGSPRTQRLMRIDENKIRDLEQVQNQITNYWSQKGRLPQTLMPIMFTKKQL
jgi:peptidoglycan/LPS O-acetylase OafA/YrhL